MRLFRVLSAAETQKQAETKSAWLDVIKQNMQ